MKTLYLVRHGKSSWHYPELDDRERPLKHRGESDAHLMGKLLRKKDIEAGTIISSPAKRALDTAEIFAKELHYKDTIVTDEKLYMKGTKAILETAQHLPNQVDHAFFFSHNPDLLDFANIVSGKEHDNVPTCGVVCIEFKVDNWADASLRNAKLGFFDYPSKHK